MVSITFCLDDDAAEFVTDRLTEFNQAQCELIAERASRTNDPYPIHVMARSEDGSIVGGLVGQIWDSWHWLQIDVIWVTESHRNADLGTRLMRAAEDEGRRLGCVHARLTTSSYQALGFYQKLGYISWGTLEGFPAGTTNYYMRKQL